MYVNVRRRTIYVGKVFENAFGTGQKSEDGRPASVKLSQKGVQEYTYMQPIDESQLQGDEYPFRPVGCFYAEKQVNKHERVIGDAQEKLSLDEHIKITSRF